MCTHFKTKLFFNKKNVRDVTAFRRGEFMKVLRRFYHNDVVCYRAFVGGYTAYTFLSRRLHHWLHIILPLFSAVNKGETFETAMWRTGRLCVSSRVSAAWTPAAYRPVQLIYVDTFFRCQFTWCGLYSSALYSPYFMVKVNKDKQMTISFTHVRILFIHSSLIWTSAATKTQ